MNANDDQEDYDHAAEVDGKPDEIVPIEGIAEELEQERREKPVWDKKSRSLMRQIVTQKVELPISRLCEMIDDKEIDLAPGFQRRLRWTRAQQSRLIESIIMNVPIPPVFLGEHKPGRHVVLDGRQRLTAIYQYLNDEFKLSGLEVWGELNGKKFKNLRKEGDPPIASAITRRFIPAVLILHESVPEVKYEVFDRLNTGGVIAEPMEVRNAIYWGKFNDLIHDLAEIDAFRTLWHIPLDEKQRKRNPSYRKMVDLEMTLRFFAFQEYGGFKGGLRNFLNTYMSKRNKQYEETPDLERKDRELFTSTISRTLALLGPDAFHRTVGEGVRSQIPSAPLADAVLYAISRLNREAGGDEEGARIRAIFDDLCLNDEVFRKSITLGTNATVATSYRIETAARRVLGLAADAQVP